MSRLATALLLLLLATPGRAATIHVPGDQPTIQAGIDAAAAGDTVEIACGTYFEHGILVSSSVAIQSGPHQCVVIDAQGLGRIFRCDAPGDTVTFTSLDFVGGMADSGAAVYVAENTSADFWSCEFYDNVAHNGAAIFGSNAYLRVRQTTIEQNGTINSASTGGTAISATDSSLDLIGLLVRDNIGGILGGAFLFESCDAYIRECDFHRNTAQNGGAVSSVGSILGINWCSFDRNTVSGSGRALHMIETSCEVGQTTISYNAGTDDQPSNTGGGAIYAAGGSLDVKNCTFYGNAHELFGSMIYAEGGEQVFLDRCILAANGPSSAIDCSGGSVAYISCTDSFGNEGGDWTGCIVGQGDSNGNFSENPLFCDPERNDFRLLDNSPCRPPGPTACGLLGSTSNSGNCNVVSAPEPLVEEVSWGHLKVLYAK